MQESAIAAAPATSFQVMVPGLTQLMLGGDSNLQFAIFLSNGIQPVVRTFAHMETLERRLP